MATRAKKPAQPGRGKWEKDGPSPNPRGRPRKEPKPLHNRQLREDFFEISQLEIVIPVQGKKRKMTLMQAIFFKEFEQGLNGHAISRRNLMKWFRMLITEEEDWVLRFHKIMLQREAAGLERKKEEFGLTREEQDRLDFYNSPSMRA